MILACNADKPKIIDAIKDQKITYAYLYIDLLNEDLETGNVCAWLNVNRDRISQVVINYHDSFQLYSDPYYSDLDELLALVHEHHPLMISGIRMLIERVFPLIGQGYAVSYGKVLVQPLANKKQSKCELMIETATRRDMSEIACLICSDASIGGHYRKKDLEKQLEERSRESKGRNLVIRAKDTIIAHYATYAEAQDIAVMGGLIVKPEYRGQGFAHSLHSKLTEILLSEGRTPILFCTDPDTVKMYERLGAKVHSAYGKIIRLGKGDG